MGRKRLNCWEFKKCGREPGGKNVEELGVCPTCTAQPAHGVNQGECGGRVCWVISGTFCQGEVQGSFARKMGNCTDCDFYKLVRKEEGFRFDLGTDLLTEIYTPHQLAQAYEQLHFYLQNLKEMEARLVSTEKLAGLGQLAAGVAHEINNPIAFVSSNIGVLAKYMETIKNCLETYDRITRAIQQEPDDRHDSMSEEVRKLQNDNKLSFILEDIDQILAESMEGVARVRDIVHGLKKISRIDESEKSRTCIEETIRNALRMIPAALLRHCTVETAEGELPDLFCNPSELEQAFLNILTNAAESLEGGAGKIRVTTDQEDGEIVVRISDTGCGMPEDRIKKIFDPFYTTKPVGKGTGLGLAIALGTITGHGGTIDVWSEEGKGTSFTVRIPVVTEPE